MVRTICRFSPHSSMAITIVDLEDNYFRNVPRLECILSAFFGAVF